MSATLLAGGVRGTKTTLGPFPLRGDPKTPHIVTAFPSAKYPDLASILREFLARNRGDVRYANFALKVLATGGVRVAGDVPSKVLPLMRGGSFIKAFTKKGRMSQPVSRMPVQVVLHPGVALLGAASYGFESIRLNPGLSRELGD
jgi:glucokinase